MEPSSGSRITCDCCRDICNDEFEKIVELKDVGVTVYRYLPQSQDETEKITETGEVFILLNTGGNDLKIEEIMESGKRKVSCPRCIKKIQHVKSLFKYLPPINVREVTGVCDHCYQKELFHCTCCEQIVDKFLKFRLREAIQTEKNKEGNKEWLVKSQFLLRKSISNLKDSKLEPHSKSEGHIQQSQISTSSPIPVVKPAQELPLIPDVNDRDKGVSESIHEHVKRPFVAEDHKVSASRDIPTIEPIPTIELAPIPEVYEKQTVKDESKLAPKKEKYQFAQQNVEKAFKDFRVKHQPPEPSEPREPRTEAVAQGQKHQAPTTSKKIPVAKPIKEHRLSSQGQGVRDDFIKIPKKQVANREKEVKLSPKKYPLSQEDIEKTLKVLSFLDFPESIGRSEDDIKPMKVIKTGILKSRDYVARDNVTFSAKPKRPVSASKYSFGTIMKSLSDPNVSVFSYSFPHDKIPVKQHIADNISSSELIKQTQDMLQDRIEEEKKKKIELKKLKEENKRMAEKQRELKLKEGEEPREKEREKETESLREEETVKEKKESIESSSSLKIQLDKQQKELPDHKKYGLSTDDKKTKELEKTKKDKQKPIEAENKIKHTEAKPDSEYDRKDKISLANKSGVREKKITEREKQPQRLPTTKELKEKTGEEKIKKQEKALADTKSGKIQEIVPGETKDGKIQEIALAEISGKEQEIPPAETDAEKTQKEKEKQLAAYSKRKLIESKGEIGKDEPLDKAPKEEKTKDNKHSEMAAVLVAEMAKQKQLDMEKERLRKEQERERELLEKKMKEFESKKEIKVPLIQPPILVPEFEEADDDDIVEVIFKPEDVANIIKGQKIYKIVTTKIAEENQPNVGSIQFTEQKTKQKSKLTRPKQRTKQKTAKQESELAKSKQNTEPKIVKQESDLPKQSKEQKQLTEQKTPEAQRTVPEAKQDSQNKPPGGTQTTKTPEATTKPAATTAEKKQIPLPDPTEARGLIRYTLSDRSFIDKGWTMLPTEKVVRKMNVYRMRPAKPEFDWFEHNRYRREMSYYDSGEKLAQFDDNGRGRWYYRSGELALDYYDAEETNAGQRFVVYSTVLPDERGRSRPKTVLATFDYSGNGIVFDHTGKIRLKYNQTEGVVLDRTIGPVSHWKWHTLNDPPVLQQVMIDTQMPYKDPTILHMGDKQADQKRPDNEEMIAIEFENFLKEKRQKLTQSFKPFQIKMKALKINEFFSLRVMDQASVYLLYRDGSTNLKINMGMLLDHKEIVDTDTAEIGEVSNALDKLPACTDSIAGLQKAVARAQAIERSRVRYERRLKRPEMTSSVDALRAGCSRPPRTPLVQASLTSCDKMTPRRFKPSCCDVYYSTQLY